MEIHCMLLTNVVELIPQGVQYPQLHVCITNTSLIKLSDDFFKNIGHAKNLSVDVRNNHELKVLMNPSTGSKPDLYRKTFLKDLKMSGNRWTCDCDLGYKTNFILT